MAEIYFGDYRKLVIEHIKIVEAQVEQSHTIEWFLVRYLKRIARDANPPTSKGRMENAMRALVRFYVDNLDESSDLGQRCQLLYDEYRKTIRIQQES